MNESLKAGLNWEKAGGLIPAVIQDAVTGVVLMLGYMSPESLDRSLETRKVTFWSRSRRTLWTKGETSGNFLELLRVSPDCDGDSLLIQAIPTGPTCHTGQVSCFAEESNPSGGGFILELEELVNRRRRELPEGSYTTELFQSGLTRIGKKLGEEAVETILSAWEGRDRTVSETADLIYHLLVFLAALEVSWGEVLQELSRRHRRS